MTGGFGINESIHKGNDEKLTRIFGEEMFVKKLKMHWKIFLHTFITLILFFLVISLVVINTEAPGISKAIKYISPEEYLTFVYKNCHIENNNGTNLFVPDNSDPKVWLALPDDKFNGIKIKFVSTSIKTPSAQLYYAENGEGLSEMKSVFSVLNPIDPSEILFILPENTVYTTLRLDVEGSYAVESIEYGVIDNLEYSIKYHLNYMHIIIIALIIIFLGVFNKKIGYFTSIKNRVMSEIIFLNQLKNQSRKYKFILHLVADSLKIMHGIYFVLLLSKGVVDRDSLVSFFVLSLILMMILIFDNIFTKDSQPAKIFLIVSLITCTMNSYCMPINTGVSWDDMIHYKNVTMLKSMIYGRDETFADKDLKARLTKTDSYIESPYDACLQLLYADQFLDCEEDKDEFHFKNFYTLLGYLPAATVMFICDVCNVGFVSMIILAKLFNGVVYSLIIYHGMKRLKSGQYILSSVALAPTCLYLASVFSYDYWLNAFTMYGIAYLISEFQQPNKKITVKDMAFMLGSMFIGCGPKAIYFVLLIPFLLLSREKFVGGYKQKKYIIFVILTAMLIAMSFIIPMFNNGIDSDIRGGTDVNASEQIKFILFNIPQYVVIVLRTLVGYCSISTLNGWLNFYSLLANFTPSDSSVTLICMAMCALWDKSRSDRFKNFFLFKMITYAALLFQAILICTAMYISFTPVGSATIGGLQGRYLFPLLFPFLYCLGSVHTKTRINPKFMKSMIYGMLSLNLMCLSYSVYIVKFI